MTSLSSYPLFRTWFEGSFCSHKYLGSGFPSAEQVNIDVLWTPMVAPPEGVTRKILGGSEKWVKKKVQKLIFPYKIVLFEILRQFTAKYNVGNLQKIVLWGIRFEVGTNHISTLLKNDDEWISPRKFIIWINQQYKLYWDFCDWKYYF